MEWRQGFEAKSLSVWDGDILLSTGEMTGGEACPIGNGMLLAGGRGCSKNLVIETELSAAVVVVVLPQAPVDVPQKR